LATLVSFVGEGGQLAGGLQYMELTLEEELGDTSLRLVARDTMELTLPH
jgi:hypothetical protein